MYRLKKKLLAGILTFVMTVTALAGSEPAAWGNTDSMVTAYAAEDYGLADNTNDGVILHAWCWSFNTIKNNMKLIAQAGYTSVQTSPINECVVGDNGALTFGGHWYYHYQPTNYTIGNYQLGTEAEFIAMCNEADKYGIKIIVDVVANHMTSDWSKINSNWQNSSYFHGNTGISNWSDRYDVTQNALLGLWDLNTQSSVVQQRILSYLRQCVADGADGFRFDAAKHIELPDDQGYGGSFWPTILNNGSAFQYGEILQDSISRDSAYSQYMNVTASSYGYVVREQLAANDLSSSRLSAYYTDGVNPDNLVTWVESHDNYCDGVSTYMSNNDLRFAWAILASRRYGTPLFFSRPKGGGNGVMFPEQSRLGDMGDAFFYDNTIVAVNRFHNEMIDQSESMKNYNGTSTLIIERGNKGMVIVNKGAGQNLYTQTSLANGTYKDQISGSTFTVSNGNISGYINANSVYVIYNPINSYEEPETQPAPEGSLIVHFKRTDWGNGTPYIYAYTDGGTTITAGWPGTLMSADASQGSGWYTYVNAGYTSANVMFNMGVGSPDRDPGDGQPGYPVSGEVWYYQGSIYMYNPDVPETQPVTEPETQPVYYTVTYKDGNNTVLTDSCLENTSYTLAQPLSADGRVFAGWFTQNVSLNSVAAVTNALNYKAVPGTVNSNITLYAGWINASNGADAFELLGTQIKINEPSGLRFVSRIGKGLVSKLEALNAANISLKPENAQDKGIGFGTVVTMTSNINGSLIKDVNAVNVKSGMAVVPAAALFIDADNYMEYTAVVNGIPERYHNTDIAARPYITYKDANGCEQTYYYSETGNSAAGGGYSTSLYKVAQYYYNLDTTSEAVKAWIRTNILKN